MNSGRVHWHGFDLLRALGIFGVVWIHGCDTNRIALAWSVYAQFAVPVFVLISFFLFQDSVMHRPDESWSGIVARRLRRLLPAYLVWTLVYMVVRIGKHRLMGSSGEPSDWISAIFFGGAAYQLYFVAALIYWSVLISPVALYGARRKNRSGLSGLMLLAVGFLALWAGPVVRHEMNIPPEYSMISHGLGLTGYVLLGMAAAFLWNGRNHFLPLKPASGWSYAWAGASVAIWVFVPDWRLGISMVTFLWALHFTGLAMPAPIVRVSQLSYGIYLVHGLFVEGFQMLLPRLGWPVKQLDGTMAVIILSFISSFALCSAMERIKRLRWLVS